jgi:hypothetical protein
LYVEASQDIEERIDRGYWVRTKLEDRPFNNVVISDNPVPVGLNVVGERINWCQGISAVADRLDPRVKSIVKT